MFFLLLEFLAQWLIDGRIPPEDLKIRPSIAIAGLLTLFALATAIVVSVLSE
jgi:hypothetical protein